MLLTFYIDFFIINDAALDKSGLALL